MDIASRDDRFYIELAIQTVFYFNRERLNLLQDSRGEKELIVDMSREILQKAEEFKDMRVRAIRMNTASSGSGSGSAPRSDSFGDSGSLRLLSDEALLDCYSDAVNMRLDRDFIDMLFSEIKTRRLESFAANASSR